VQCESIYNNFSATHSNCEKEGLGQGWEI